MKQELRTFFLQKRSALPATQRDLLNGHIRQQLAQWPVYRQARSIFCYVSCRDEVDTRALLADLLLDQGRQLSVPVCDRTQKRIRPVRLTDLKALAPGAYGIDEPATGSGEAPDSIDLVLVPGVVFDLAGYRIGYGGGYYDRFLQEQEGRPTTAGLAFQIQLCDRVPHQPHDRPVDFIVTEKNIIHCRRKRETSSEPD